MKKQSYVLKSKVDICGFLSRELAVLVNWNFVSHHRQLGKTKTNKKKGSVLNYFNIQRKQNTEEINSLTVDVMH